MNSFYDQPKLLQWIAAILWMIISFMPLTALMDRNVSLLVFYLLLPLYVPVAQFAWTPLFRLVGVYKYYAPMLLGFMANDLKIDLHSGTSFDYLFVMRKYRVGVEMRNRLLMYHLEGLLNIIQQIADGHIPESVSIEGTSYFFNNRSLQKMGFEVAEASFSYRLNLLVNIIDLTWMYSLSQGKFAIPKVWDAKKAHITGAGLRANKDKIAALYNRMKAKASA